MSGEIGSVGDGRKLLDVAREKMRTRHLAYRTEQAYLQWIRRYIVVHNRRHPRHLGAAEVEQFLTHLAVQRKARGANACVAEGTRAQPERRPAQSRYSAR